MSSIAAKIMIIRHAEKPGVSGGGAGIARDGSEDAESLTVRGWTRARALVSLFVPASGHTLRAGLATPRVVYASGLGKHSNSLRPQETILPLCEKLGLTATTDYLKDEFDEMTADALAQTGPVLICWEHLVIPDIADQILGDETTAPRAWPDDRFDVVWVFDLDRASGTYRFQQIPESLLAGDRPDPID
jgi:hypothetical protein